MYAVAAKRAIGATAAAMLVFSTAAAMAQDASGEQPRVANGERFGPWTVNCEAVAVNETVCVLNQRLVRSSDRAFLAEFLAFSNLSEGRTFLAARVPIGVHFPSGFSVRIDPEAEDVVDLTWQSCATDLCEALIELDDETTAALHAAGGAIAGYRPRFGAEALVFRVDMTGLRDGLDALTAALGADDGADGASAEETETSQ